MQRALASLQPASLHRLAIKLQKRRTSSALSTALLERTRRQSSLANTQVLTYLNSSTACCRISWRVSSNYVSFSGTHLTKLYHSSSSHSSFLCSTHCLTSARFRSPLRTESKSRRGTKNSWFRTLMVRLFPDLLRETHPTFTIFSSSPVHLPQKDTMCLYTSRARLLPLVFFNTISGSRFEDVSKYPIAW